MKKKLFTLVTLAITSFTIAQDPIVNIPDPVFKAYLVANTDINTSGDDEIQVSEAEAFTGPLFIMFQPITDLTGIEAFVNLTNLYIEGANLGNFNFNNILPNSLTQLSLLICGITSINVSTLTNLTFLSLFNNSITELDVSNLTNLEFLQLNNNLLTVLDVSNNTNLENLNCSQNQLTSLDVSAVENLKSLVCSFNQLTSLDVSNNPVLNYLICNDNQLTELNFKNGNNSNIVDMWSVYLVNNNLSCIQVDDVAFANSSNWSNQKDATACFSESCASITFDSMPIVCYGDTAATLPNMSQENVTGTWSPNTINIYVSGTQNYVFTPSDPCTTNAYTMAVNVADYIPEPIGEMNQQFTAGQTIADLVVTGENLVWSSGSTFSDTLALSEPLVDGATYYVRSEIGSCISFYLPITVEQIAGRNNFDLFGFRYHPNPVNDVLHFSSNSKIEKVVISNMLGQQINANLNSDNTILDVSNLSRGNYFVKVTIEGVSKTIKVIKN